MMIFLIAILTVIFAYLIGSINFSILLSRIVGGKDIRESGSGNAGATNMLRTYGKKMGVATLLLDVLKGIVVILIARIVIANFELGILTDILPYTTGLGVILGHNFPVYFGFKGGKGVATSLGVVLMLDWKVGLFIAFFALTIMALTRYVSLGSILGGFGYIVIELVKSLIQSDFNALKFICVLMIGGLLIARHHANIKRLLAGTENKLGSKKEK